MVSNIRYAHGRTNHAAAIRPQSTLLSRAQAFLRLAALSLLALTVLSAHNSAWAVIVPPGPHKFDTNLPGISFVGYDGANFFTPVVAPKSTMGVSIDLGALNHSYPNSEFHIDSGFKVLSSFLFDPSATGTIAAGEALFVSVGAGSFHINDAIGTILSGTFTSATFTSAFTSTAGSLSSSNINGLVLTPGPAFKFDGGTFVSAIAPSPTGFSISLSSIPGGVSVVGPTGPGLSFIPVTLSPFALSVGSTVVSGNMTVVPEPSTFALAAVAGVGMIYWRRRRRA